MNFLNLVDLEGHARQAMPQATFDYFAGAAGDEVTLRENRLAFDRIALAYRVLRGMSGTDCTTTVLGQKVAMPVLVAPMAFQQLAHDAGEPASARAAAAAGTIMILSTLSTVSVEEVAAATSGPLWFQLYIYKDRGVTAALVQRAEAAGCKALVWTVDAPVLGRRERDVRNRFHLPPGMTAKNLLPLGHGNLDQPPSGSGLAEYVANLLDPAISWRDLEWLATLTRLPVLVKGIVRGDDAVRAAEGGAAGIVVSNHGGRQLDSAPATIEALPEVIAALASRSNQGTPVEVFIDGGIRRGTDVVKALALGARAVLLGRPVLWGLALDGEAGVAAVLNLLREELINALLLCGCADLGEIGPDLLRRR